jgi:peptidoglycan hydrolase-like protein with peptidoglycan-binding domain
MAATCSTRALCSTPAGVLQVLLGGAHFSPGEIDGKFGENAKKALRAYEEAQQLPISDDVNADVWLSWLRMVARLL